MKITSQQIEHARKINLCTYLNLPNPGRRNSIRCPFHNERVPSCVVYPHSGYHCFACGAHGNNTIDFLMGLGMKFTDAVIELQKYT